MNPPLPSNEPERLARLRQLQMLDTAPEPIFDSLVQLASQVCGMPIGLLSLVDEERQWFKANVGLPGFTETPREWAFCTHTLLHDTVFEVPDARLDPRFATSPLVTGPPHFQFYAGAPLVMPGGERVGTLCVLDRQPRKLDDAQTQILQSLAAVASQALVMRQDLITQASALRTEYEHTLAQREERHRAIVEDQTELVSLAHADGELVYVNPAYARHFGRTPHQLIGANLFDYVEPRDRDAVRNLVAQVLRTGTTASDDNRMVAADGTERWVAWTNSVHHEAQPGGIGMQTLLHSVGRDVTERRRAEQALRASQAFLFRTGRVAGVGGWEQDLASGAVTWSDETRRIHEVGPEHVPTQANGLSFYAPEARATIEEAVLAGIQHGKPWDLELPFVTGNGRHIWVRAVGEVEFEGGKPVRLVGAFQDITERIQLQQRLADNERFVRQITDSLPVRIAYADNNMRFRFANLAVCQRFGLARDQILGRTRSELTQGIDDAVLGPKVAAVLAGQTQRFEYEAVENGESRLSETQLIPDISETGEVRGYYITGTDITERTAAERAMRELTTIFDNTTDFVVQTNWRGTITYMNPAVRRATGLAPDAPLAQHNFNEFNTPATQRLFIDVIVPTVKAHGVWVGETTVYANDRREVPVSHMVIAHFDALGRVGHYSAVMRDISAAVSAQQQLQRQTATLRSVTEAIPAMVAVVGADGRYRFVNSAYERWAGAQRDHIVGHTVPEVLGHAEHDRGRHWRDRALAGETVNFEMEYPGRSQARHLAISYIPLWQSNGAVDGYVGVAQDITHHKQEEVRLLQLTQRDALTGLLNRTGFEEHLERRLQEGGGATLALLYIDLDHFKPVNDLHGHPVGDQVLQLFAQRLSGLVRPTDAVARVGGDEFAVVLAGVRESANAHAVANKVIAAAHAPFEVGSLLLHIGASVGVAFGVEANTGWGDLVARADAMLYRAKEAGRGRQAGELLA